MPKQRAGLASHDQNFKNLIQDFPIEAIEFFAGEAFPKIKGSPKVTFLRQEQRKKKLSDSFSALDIPILLEWPNSHKKAAIVFAIEPEASPYKFDIIRLVEYLLKLGREHNTTRLVPVVVFLQPGRFQESLRYGTKKHEFLNFRFIACQLWRWHYHEWKDSNNIVARITLPLMRYNNEEKLHMAHHSMVGLFAMGKNDAIKGKYTEFIAHYAKITEQDMMDYKHRYPEEEGKMTSYIMQLRQESERAGIQQGVKQGVKQGERNVLLKLLKSRFALQAEEYETKVAKGSAEEIDRWLDNILDAEYIEDVFR